MKLTILLLISAICATNCFSIIEQRFIPSKLNEAMLGEWSLFKTKYEKKYDSAKEEQVRFEIFLENKKNIAKHNEKFVRGETSFFLGMNKFGDLVPKEFASRMNGFKKKETGKLELLSENEIGFGLKENQNLALDFLEPANVVLPDQIDWRKLGAVTPIKDQGQCGSCWAFSATGSLEGQHFRHNGTLISLSEQNLIDCSIPDGNEGCDGGLMNDAFTYVKRNHGLDTEKSYPYEGKDDRCRYNPKNSGADDAGYVTIPQGNEAKLQAAVATAGPISVAIDASSFSFQFYSGGVYYEPECSSTFLDHGVLAVGYGTDSKTNKPYWLVKNSWGTEWGEQGYIRMSRNRRNNCGIATFASYPLVK